MRRHKKKKVRERGKSLRVCLCILVISGNQLAGKWVGVEMPKDKTKKVTRMSGQEWIGSCGMIGGVIRKKGRDHMGKK